MSNASDCCQWWRKLFIEVGGPSAWCEGNHFKVVGLGPRNEIFLAELSQFLYFYTFACQKWMSLCLLGPRVPPSMTATQLRNLVKITVVRKASSTSYEP